MKFVRTVRGYQSLNAEVGGKTLTVDRTGLEVNDDVADELAEVGEQHGIAIEVLDSKPEDQAAVATGQVNTRPVDLSAGRAAISGGGAPVMTTDVAKAEADTAAEDSGDDGDGGDVDYRALQERAKELDIPANQSRAALEAAIAEKE